MAQICFPETSVEIGHYTLRNNQEELRSDLLSSHHKIRPINDAPELYSAMRTVEQEHTLWAINFLILYWKL
jgi:hypothetical protein